MKIQYCRTADLGGIEIELMLPLVNELQMRRVKRIGLDQLLFVDIKAETGTRICFPDFGERSVIVDP